MADAYQPLIFHPLSSGASCFRPRQQLPQRLQLDSPAVDAMTDFNQVTAYTTELTTPIDKAREKMIKRGVRLLIVCDGESRVRGLITSRDLEGERPRRILEKSYLTREEILVRDIMTTKGKLDVLEMRDVLKARIGDIIATLRRVDRQHAMVVDVDPISGEQGVRGLFSLSQIAQQLGIEVDPAAEPITASSLEQQLDALAAR